MRTNSYISAAALAAALLTLPQSGFAQDDGGLNLNLGAIGVDADVDLGGDNLLDVDAGVDLGDDTGVDASIEVGGTGPGDSLVDVDLDTTAGSNRDGSLVEIDVGGESATGPNGGRLIDLGRSDDDATVVSADVDVLSNEGSSRLLTGDVRIASLGEGDTRADALLGLIDSPNLVDIDLDAAIDDTRVSILAAADLLGPEGLADVEAAINAGDAGRDELLAALSASVELGSILGTEGIDAEDVLAVQVADNGAAEVIVLRDIARIAALGDDGNLADLTLAESANADIDLLSDDEVAEAELALPADATAGVRLLATADAEDGAIDLADLSVAELADLDVDLLVGDDSDGTGTGGSDGNGGSDEGGSSPGSDDGSNGDSGTDNGDDASTGGGDIPVPGALPPTQVGAGFGIAVLGCSVGVLALANGLDASPQAIAGADSLELVRIDGCERSLVDVEVDAIRSAIEVNPAISNVLDDASIPVDEVVGATIQGGTLTLFIDPVVS